MLRSLGIRLVPSACAAALVALFAAAPLPPLSGVGPGRVARAAEAIASAETNTAGLVAEIIQCRRIEGVLSIYMRLHNTTDTNIDVPSVDFDSFYVTAKNKKYLLMRDRDRNFLASRPAPGSNSLMLVTLKKGANWIWWGKYAAPPSDVNMVSFYTPFTIPFDRLPVKDE